MCGFGTFGDALGAQVHLRGKQNDCRDQCLGQRKWPTTSVTTDQSHQSLTFPYLPPVVDLLVTDIEFFLNDRAMLTRSQHEQSGSERSGFSSMFTSNNGLLYHFDAIFINLIHQNNRGHL